MKLNKQIKYYRKNKGMSQDELSKKVFTTKSTISKWESGEIVPSIETVKKLAKVFDVGFYKLIGEKEPVSKTIVNSIGRLFIWLFIWVHIDITIGGVLAITGAAFGLTAILGSVGGGITMSIMYSINDVWSSLKIAYVVVMVLSFPVMFIVFSAASFLTMKLTEFIYMNSLRFFWRVNIDKYKPFKIGLNRISKKWWIAISIVTIISIIIVGAFFAYVGITDNFNEIGTSNK